MPITRVDKPIDIKPAHIGSGFCLSLPRCRFGFFHIVHNDYYDGWGQYAIGGSAHPTIVSQGNRFRASGIHKEVY
jgi:pectate lyase